MRLALLTDEHHPLLTDDDQQLPTAFSRQGIEAVPVVWSQSQNWIEFDCVLIRTPWDYTERFREFQDMLNTITAAGIALFPQLKILDWNMNKRYLQDLTAWGIDTTPTRVLEKYDSTLASSFFEELKTDELVVKPLIGAAGRETFRVKPGSEQTTRSLQGKPVLIQPFQKRVLQDGERSLVFIDGRYSHAVDKFARSGEFRVQDDHGGTVHLANPTLDEIQQARNWLSRLPWPTLYARVDTVRNTLGIPQIMELELVEPELFFRFNNTAAENFSFAVKKWLASSHVH